MFETQLAQIAATIPTYDFEKILGRSEISFENINVVIKRDGKSTRDLPYPNHVGKPKKHKGKTLNLRLWASLGEDPHKVTCILHSHHFPLPCIKNTKREWKKNLWFYIAHHSNIFTSVGWILVILSCFLSLCRYVLVWVLVMHVMIILP